jgi:hypothetical protein
MSADPSRTWAHWSVLVLLLTIKSGKAPTVLTLTATLNRRVLACSGYFDQLRATSWAATTGPTLQQLNRLVPSNLVGPTSFKLWSPEEAPKSTLITK